MRNLLLCLLMLALAAPAFAGELVGVRMDDQITAGEDHAATKPKVTRDVVLVFIGLASLLLGRLRRRTVFRCSAGLRWSHHKQNAQPIFGTAGNTTKVALKVLHGKVTMCRLITWDSKSRRGRSANVLVRSRNSFES